MKTKIISLVLAVASISGCGVAHPPMSRDEFLSTTRRDYADISPDQVFSASEKLFRLADGNDFAISWTDDSVIANRSWSIYLVFAASFGTDYWIVKASPANGATRVQATVGSAASPVFGMPTGGGGASATTLPGGVMPIQGTAIYEVFFARLEYLLGKRSDWMSCQESNDRVKAGTVWGSNDALCNSFNMTDTDPTKPMATSN
ncbi:hypothetical protein [Caballeronia sp. dw_19]|uniref:hypothetical protein n=1 Tax=Caballeronia sp. dw_19 TaxID=2719791 RepID=UPI002101E763|nr:hypothetical protein [Caballeronia sp. dw_19]